MHFQPEVIRNAFGWRTNRFATKSHISVLIHDGPPDILHDSIPGYELSTSIASVWRRAVNSDGVTVDWKTESVPDGRTMAASKVSGDCAQRQVASRAAKTRRIMTGHGAD